MSSIPDPAYVYDDKERKIRGPDFLAEVELMETDEEAREIVAALNVAFQRGVQAGIEIERRRSLADRGNQSA